MRVNIKTTNFALSDASNVLAYDKLVAPTEKLLRAADDLMDMMLDIELAKSTKHHKEGKVWYCEANLNMPNTTRVVRAESFGESLEEAVNLTKSKLEREIKKYKELAGTKAKKARRLDKYGA